MRRDIFVETEHVTKLRSAVLSAVNAGKGYPAMVMAYAEAGTGKTIAAQNLYVELGGVYLRVFEGMSLTSFLQDLTYEIADKARPHSSNRCRQMILEKLDNKATPIFVDEADRLQVSCLEALRDIHDVTGSPIILIGEMGLPTRVAARSRINDRIPSSFRVHFGAITLSDIALYAAQTASLNLSPEAVAVIHAETKGNFRRVHNAVLSLEGAANTRGNGDIDASFAKAVLNLTQNRGKK